MGTQSTAKTIFLLVSMVGWLIVGASLMYLFPAIIELVFPSDRTHLWMNNLSRGGYEPMLGWLGGGITFVITILGTVIWYQRFEGRV